MKTVLWTLPDLHSTEYFTLTEQAGGYRLAGTINLLLDDQPTQLVYRIECDADWITRRAELQQRRSDGEKRLILTVDDALNWYQDGAPLPWAVGLTDIDLSITPSTNTLPLGKHNLQIGATRTVNCVWVQPPDLSLGTLPQRYTRIDARRYDYAAPSIDYAGMLIVDDDGIIVRYGDLWSQPGHSSD